MVKVIISLIIKNKVIVLKGLILKLLRLLWILILIRLIIIYILLLVIIRLLKINRNLLRNHLILLIILNHILLIRKNIYGKYLRIPILGLIYWVLVISLSAKNLNRNFIGSNLLLRKHSFKS